MKTIMRNKTICNLYMQGMSPSQIAKKVDVGKTQIYRILRKSNIVIRTISQSNTKYSFNHSYFNKIDSEDKAYFLGLIYADGNICKNKNSSIVVLTSKDTIILKKFLECINSNGKIYREFHKIHQTYCYKVRLTSKQMFDDLNSLGCVPRKSLILMFPASISLFLIPHFIRGYFDGDGTVGIYKCSKTTWKRLKSGFVGTKSMLEGIQRSMKTSQKYVKHDNLFILNYSVFQSIDLYHYLYDNSSIFLPRKRNIFEKYLKQRSSTTTIDTPQGVRYSLISCESMS